VTIRAITTFVLQQFVQATAEFVDLSQTEVLTQKVGHGAFLIPVAMQPPFTARLNQA